MKKFLRNRLNTFLYAFVLFAFAFLVWQFLPLKLSRLWHASPNETYTALCDLVFSGKAFSLTWATLFRSVQGFFYGASAGVLAGVGLAFLRERHANILIPYFDFLRSLPALALLPFFIMVFGFGEICRIAIVVWAVFFVLAQPTYQAVRDANEYRVSAGKVMGLHGFRLLLFVNLPDAFPHILAALRLGVSISILVTLVAEMLVGSEAGLGRFISEEGQWFRAPNVFAGILITGGIAVIVNKLFEKIVDLFNWNKATTKR